MRTDHHHRLLRAKASFAFLVAVLLLATGAATASAALTCMGHTATIVGTDGPDTLYGTGGRDVIVARGGNDTVYARGGDDIVCAGVGDDRVRGGPGNDRVSGAAGTDVLAGNTGRDVLRGGSGNDRLKGQRGADRLRGGVDWDLLDGGWGNDRVHGGGGNDTLVYRHGNDVLDGGTSADRYPSDDPRDVYDHPQLRLLPAGEASSLSVDLASGTLQSGAGTASLTNLRSVVGWLRGPWTVAINGDSHPNRLEIGHCGAASFLVRGAGGGDIISAQTSGPVSECSETAQLLGGAGDDHITGGEHDDHLDGGDGNDFLDGVAGTDTCINGEVVVNCP